jgi:sec-independent protein translocase protein TatC
MDEQRPSLWEHLMALKNTVFKIVFVWAVASGVAMYFSAWLMDFYTKPLGGITLNFLSPTDAMFLILKLAGFTGLVVTFPVILFFLWQYIRPALKNNEKRFVIPYVFSILTLSYGAIIYGYYSMIPLSLRFLLGIQLQGTQFSLTATSYFDFIIALFFILVLISQAPILVFTLIKAGMVKPETFKKKRREIYLGTFIGMAIITPTPDVFTLFMITIPVLVLFELSLLVSQIGLKKKEEVATQSFELPKNVKVSL